VLANLRSMWLDEHVTKRSRQCSDLMEADRAIALAFQSTLTRLYYINGFVEYKAFVPRRKESSDVVSSLASRGDE
jgi:hypothetical protein